MTLSSFTICTGDMVRGNCAQYSKCILQKQAVVLCAAA